MITDGKFEVDTDGWSALEEMRHERLSGPRMLVWGCLGGLLIWAAILFAVCTVSSGIRPLGLLP